MLQNKTKQIATAKCVFLELQVVIALERQPSENMSR